MSANSLKGTPLETIYTIFSVYNDEKLCAKMASIAIVSTTVVAAWFALHPFPYGRYTNKRLGPTVNTKLGWMVLDCGSLLFPVGLALFTPAIQLANYANIVSLSMFVFHYVQRSLIYPMTMSSQAKPVPLIFVSFACIATTYNGFLQGHHLANVYKVKVSLLFFVGVVIYLAGLIINVTHDQILVSLRERASALSNGSISQKSTYQIPRGGLFEYISGANYFGEILEWIGIAIATQQLPQIASAVWSIIFLGTRAMHHHRFYKETFSSVYPKSRKAIIPFLL